VAQERAPRCRVVEGILAGEEQEQDHAHGVDVRAIGDVPCPVDLLGRHERRRAQDRAGARRAVGSAVRRIRPEGVLEELATPKSRSFSPGADAVSMTFAGFTSRWITPHACAAPSASQSTDAKRATTLASQRLPA